jgi:hypothetical protein
MVISSDISTIFSILQCHILADLALVQTVLEVMFKAVFWVVLPCKMIVDRRFRGTCCLHHQGWMTIILHSSTTQKTALNGMYIVFLLNRPTNLLMLYDVVCWNGKMATPVGFLFSDVILFSWYCYIYEVSLDTQQCWTALVWLVDNNLNKQQCYAGNNR